MRGAGADHPTLAPRALLAGYLRGWFPMDEEGATGPVGLYEAVPRAAARGTAPG
jgi:Leu/Phe-tRNA-protein transferase